MFVLEQYGDVPLPLLEARQDVSSGASLSPFRQLQQGGAYRVRGLERSPRTITRISTTGEFVEDTSVDLVALGRALYAERGKVAKLYRRQYTGERHWCWAELMQVVAETTPVTGFVQPIGLDFTMISPSWYGTGHGTTWEWGDADAWASGVAWAQEEGEVFFLSNVTNHTDVELMNGGNYPIDNCIITITANVGASLTDISIVSGLEAHIIWNGTIPAGQHLVFDCGAKTVTLNGAPVYQDFEIGPDHKLAGWLRLHPGVNAISIGHSVALSGQVRFAFSDGEE